MTAEDLAQRVLSRDRRALARLLTRVENRDPEGIAALKALYPHTGRAAMVGITGLPGAGKSTLVFALASELRRRGLTVGIVAVDPSSPFTRGAILGDRVRMQELTGDPGVFIRSMATRGALGGLAVGTIDTMSALDAFGMDYVIVETVGAGQDEVDVVRAAQTVVVVEIPGTGDAIQALKAGILEIADVFVVNKADRDGADAVAANLRQLLSLAGDKPPHYRATAGDKPPRYGASRGSRLSDDGAHGEVWRPPIVKTVAVTQDGIPELADAIAAHQQYLREGGQLKDRQRERAQFQVLALTQQALSDRLHHSEALDRLVRNVCERRLDPHTASEQLARWVMGLDGPDPVSSPG